MANSNKTNETVKLNASVQTTSVTQTGNEVLGTKEKNLYYLIIKNEKGGQLVINVGQKTHDEVKKLTNE